jgi:hypothetical protein
MKPISIIDAFVYSTAPARLPHRANEPNARMPDDSTWAWALLKMLLIVFWFMRSCGIRETYKVLGEEKNLCLRKVAQPTNGTEKNLVRQNNKK